MARKWLLIPVILSSLGMLLVACGVPEPTQAPVEEDAEEAEPEEEASVEAEPIDIVVGMPPFLSNGPVFIALEEGYFEEVGLNVEIESLRRTSENIAALATGDLDMAAGAIGAGILNAMIEDGGIRLVADKGYIGEGSCYNSIVVSPDLILADGSIDAEALRGGQIRVSEAGSSEYFVDVALQGIGVDIDDMVNLDVPQSTIAEVIASGELDLALMSEPTLSAALATGQVVQWLPDSEILPGYQYAFVMFGPNLLEENPEAGNRFMVAYLRAVRQYNEGKTGRNVEILSQYTEIEPEVLEAACWPSLKDDLSVSVDDVLAMQAWAVERGYMDAELDPAAIYDPQFVEYALENVGQ